MIKKHLLSYSVDELKNKLLNICDKPFRLKQILQWIYSHHVVDFEQMTNVPKDILRDLSNEFENVLPEIVDIKKSYDNSVKFLLKLRDEALIEMVYIPTEKKNTLCISTQVGCSRNCSFCATAKIGLKRNLTTEELVSQFFVANGYFKNDKMTNIVLMGMGEPLDNIESLINFLNIMTANEGLDFSGRKITISTCGIVPKIYTLADMDLKFKLAISLNSAIDSKRSYMMPINDTYPLNELKKAVLYFRSKSRFRVTFEYIMISDFNMGKEDVRALKKFCGDISCKINLLKWNEIHGLAWKSPTEKQIESFIKEINHLPIAVTYRKSRGGDIAGACGQLAGGQN